MRDEKQDEREWGIAKVVESNEEAIVVAGYLNSNGIRAEIESLHVEELPVNLGALGEVRVRVPADRLDEAVALLDAMDRDAPAPAEADAADEEEAPLGGQGDRPE